MDNFDGKGDVVGTAREMQRMLTTRTRRTPLTRLDEIAPLADASGAQFS